MSKGFSRRSRRTPGAARSSVRADRPRALCAGRIAGRRKRSSRRRGGLRRSSCAPARRCRAGEMRCFALRRTTGVRRACRDRRQSGRRGQRLRAVRPRQRVQRADDARLGRDGRDRRRLRRPERRERPRHLPQQLRPAGRARPPTAASGRSTRTARPVRSRRPNTGWASEITLDLDMVSAICPNCHILLVEATSPTTANLGTAVNTAVALGAIVVSNSYGGSESLERAELRQLVLQAPRRGDHRLVRRQRLRRGVSGRLAVRHRRRRHRR